MPIMIKIMKFICDFADNVYRDDLTSRRGINYTDDEVWRFASSWKVGGIKACSRKHENLAKAAICRLKKGGQFCKPLRESEIFDDCGSRLNPEHYFESCRKDMCECPSGKCYCDSFSAYAHECKRVGGFVSEHWRRDTGCEHNSTASSHNFNKWMATNHASNQLTAHSKLHRNRQKMRQRFHGGSGGSSSSSLRFNHHHNRKYYPVSTFGMGRSEFPLRSQDQEQEQMILSQHVPRELRLQNRTPPPLV